MTQDPGDRCNGPGAWPTWQEVNMLKTTCIWQGCDRRAYTRGLCERCNMRARRAGTLHSFKSPDVECQQCGRRFAEGSLAGKRFCSHDCQQASLRTRYAVRRVALIGERTCRFCLEPVPVERRADARHCSITCQQADWYVTNEARLREKARRWAAAHRDDRNEYQHRRESRKRGIAHETIDLRLVWERDAHACWICGVSVDPNLRFPDPASRSLDHVIPLANGGTHTMGNVATAHLRCNISKKDKLLGYLPSWFVREREEEPDALDAEPA